MPNKTYSQYCQYIRLMLGAIAGNESSLEYSNEDLTKFVETAFTEVEPYINTRERFTIPWNQEANGAIDFKLLNRKAKAVVKVRRGSDQGYLNQVLPSTAGTWYYGWYLPQVGTRFNANFDPWAMQALMLKSMNEISGDKDYIFDYEKQLLFINFNTQYPRSVTIEYIPEYENAEQITDSYWQNIIQQYSLALVKISLSHFRGKYSSVQGSMFQLDYERLIQEGQNERDKIWEELTESNLLNYRFE